MERFDYMNEIGSYDYSPTKIAGMTDEELETEINHLDSWDFQLLYDLCWRADMIEEFEAANGTEFEAVAYAAAKKIGIKI